MSKHKVPKDLFLDTQLALKDFSRYEPMERYFIKKVFIAGSCGEAIEDIFIRSVQTTLSRSAR